MKLKNTTRVEQLQRCHLVAPRVLLLQICCFRVINSHARSQTRSTKDFGGSCDWLLGLFYARTCSLLWCDMRARTHCSDLGTIASTTPANRMRLSSSSVFILGSAWLYLILASIGHSSGLSRLAAAVTPPQRRRSSPGQRCPLQECGG